MKSLCFFRLKTLLHNFQKFWNSHLEWKTKQLNGPGNYRELRETGPWRQDKLHIFGAKLKLGDTIFFYNLTWFWELYYETPSREYLIPSLVRKFPDFSAIPVNLHWRQDSKSFPACWILIGQFKFQAGQPYARRLIRVTISTVTWEMTFFRSVKFSDIWWVLKSLKILLTTEIPDHFLTI